jgi:pimeloyl-ACP methyl ester carboxylesterase
MARHIVLIPGLLCNSKLFVEQLAVLQRTFNIIVPERELSCHAHIRDVAGAIAASCPDRFALAGFSFGGYVALELASRFPERITHFGLISSQVRPDSLHTSARRASQIATACAESSLHAVLRQQVPLLLGPQHLPADADARIDACSKAPAHFSLVQTLQSYPDAAKYKAFSVVLEMALQTQVASFVNQQKAIISRSDHRKTLESLAAAAKPMLIACGREDRLIPHKVHHDMWEWAKSANTHRVHPAHGSSHHELAKNIVFHSSKSAGHMLPLEDPDGLNDALTSWLSIA